MLDAITVATLGFFLGMRHATDADHVILYQVLRPLIVGIVHGLAGSAAVALLVLAAIQDPVWAVAYLVVFGVGTIAGMMLMTIAIGVPLALAGERHAQFGGRAVAACGLISVAFGFVLTYRICFVDGLFAGLSFAKIPSG
jgi:high-affinity nickel-transport protein